MLALLLFLGAAAVDPTLHAWICPDAGQDDDWCPVRQVATGTVEASVTPVVVLVPVQGILTSLPWFGGEQPAAPRFCVSPSRAPPFKCQVG